MSDTLKPNIPLLRKSVEWVEEQDTLPKALREWRQRDFITGPAQDLAMDGHAADLSKFGFDCATKACVCGRIALENGATLSLSAERAWMFDGVAANQYGAQALGISLREAEDLFYAGNSAEQVREVAESIAARVGERL